MKIAIDINHPAHVHYFRNFIKIMHQKNYEIIVFSRDKEIAFSLLNNYNIKFISRGKGSNNVIGKFFYFFKAILFIYKSAKKFNPDILLSFSSPYLAVAASLLGKPHISFSDTEHQKLQNRIAYLFSTVFITPNGFKINLGAKHFKFNGYMELCYLHPNYFTPDPSILDLLDVKKNEKYIILRFVAWAAFHDVGQSGLSLEMKRKAVKELSKYAKVFISSEGDLPKDLKKYQIKIPPEKMHDALAFASLFVGESPTMTMESIILGTPSILISSWACNSGNMQDIKKNKLIYCFTFDNKEAILEKSIYFLEKEKNIDWHNRRKLWLNAKIDVTAFMVWFIENYPESAKIMKENPDYQYRFK